MAAEILRIDFIKRKLLTPSDLRTGLLNSSAFEISEITMDSSEKEILEFFDSKIRSLEARYGDRQPIGGVLNKTRNSRGWIDTYGRGCVHNSTYQFFEYRIKNKSKWNRPMPFPSDLRKLISVLKKNKGKTLKVGENSDPFQWMDCKYQITKSLIVLATKYGVKLEIHTASDLCGKDDYISLIKNGGHSIVMLMSICELKFMDKNLLEDLERRISPGMPSLLRRKKSCEKLKESGVKVSKVFASLKEILENEDQIKELEFRTGHGRKYFEKLIKGEK